MPLLKSLLFFIALVLLRAAPTLSAVPDTTSGGDNFHTEEWQGQVLTATFRAGMCFGDDGKARGVLLLRHANGQQDTYHLSGQWTGNSFSLGHGSGHSFTGEITSRTTMKGRVKLKNGMGFNLKGDRKLNVPLLTEDCAPLPERNN